MKARSKRKESKLPSPIDLRERVRTLEEELEAIRQCREEELEAFQELETSREHYADLFDFAPIGFGSLDLKGCIKSINLTGAEIFDHDRAELLGRSLGLVFSRPCMSKWRNVLAALRRGERSEFTARIASDARSVKIFGLPNDGSDTLRFAFIDITAQERAENLVRLNSLRFQRLIENAAETVTLINQDGKIGYQSPNIEELLEYPAAAFENRNIFDFIHSDDCEAVRQRISEAAASGETPKIVDARFRCVNGGSRLFEITIQNLIDEPAVGAIVLNCRDITEKRSAEEALKDADRKKDEFLAMLAHELRNPLAAMNSSLALLALPEASSEDEDLAIDVLKRRVKQLSRLIDDLLDVSRIVRGKIELKKERLDLSSAIAGAITSTRALFEEHDQELNVDISGALPLSGDAVRLEQIIANLLTNAAKYNLEKGKVWLKARREGQSAVLTIKDNGIGMSKELLPRIFDMFGQGDNSFHRSSGGLGVGLTIVKKLVDLHGGTIKASSDGAGRGSAFEVRIPLQEAEALPEQPAEVHATLRGRKLLVVEDHPDIAKMTAKFLSKSGHSVDLAFDGDSAVTLALEKHPDAILLDLGLPGKDGFEVAREIRQGGNKDTLIIAVSGYGQERDLEMARSSGINHHLLKPLDFSALEHLLEQHVHSGPT